MQKRIAGRTIRANARTLEWNDLRLFLAIARHGTLSRAARELGVTQPTVGRQLTALEAKVGAELFERGPRGLHLSPVGQRILGSAERMEAAALELNRRLASAERGLEGNVIVTALEWIGSWILAPILADFVALHPAVSVELVTGVQRYSLARREADVAIRFAQFEQLDVVQQKIGEIESALYASSEYLSERGWPDFSSSLAGHSILLLDETAMHAPGFAWLRDSASSARVALRTNSVESLLRAAEAGAGITVLARFIGDARPSLVRVDTAHPFLKREVWIGVHRDLRSAPRVRALIEHIRAGVRQLLP